MLKQPLEVKWMSTDNRPAQTMLSLPEFVARWQAAALSERSSAQSHFLDLCAVLGQIGLSLMRLVKTRI
jgi:hypothetical protein